MASRMEREARTIEAVVRIYCGGQHGGKGDPCGDCRQLLNYAQARLKRCPFQENKTTCAKCKVHCYRPAMREKVRAVMRYAGPRMIYHHPALTVLHLLDGLRKKPVTSTS